MLLQELSSCLCRGENGKPFCRAELWPALIVWIHWDFTINAVHAFQNTKKYIFWFHRRASKVHFRYSEGQTFYWSIRTVDDSIKCRCMNSGMTGQVGDFQNRGVCLQPFPSFLPHPLPAPLLVPFFPRSLTLVPRSLLLNHTETLATQAKEMRKGCLIFTFYAWCKSPVTWCSKKIINQWKKNYWAFFTWLQIRLERVPRERQFCKTSSSNIRLLI